MKLFETILYKKNELIYLKEHYDRLHSSFNQLKTSPSLEFISFDSFKNIINNKKININKTANKPFYRVRFTVDIPSNNINFFSSKNCLCDIEEYNPKISNEKNSLNQALRKSNPNFIYKLNENFPVHKNVRDLLYYDENDNITECGYSNIFFIDDVNKKIITPKIDTEKEIYLLPGIIRKKVIELFSNNSRIISYSLEIRNIKRNDIQNFSSAFITNSLIELKSITKIDEYTLNPSIKLIKSIIICIRFFSLKKVPVE